MVGRGRARFRTVRIRAWLLILLALGCIPLGAQQIQPTGAKPAFVFDGVGYLPRWPMKNQHEFTPEGQEDLENVVGHDYDERLSGRPRRRCAGGKGQRSLGKLQESPRKGAQNQFTSPDTCSPRR